MPLALTLAEHARFDNFYPGDNALVLQRLQGLIEMPEPGLRLALVGEPGLGKTHLLSALCKAWPSANLVAYWALDELLEYPPEAVLEGLGDEGLLCLDNIDAACGNEAWERALFNLYNELQGGDKHWILASKQSLVELPWRLADLRSRLSAFEQYRLFSCAEEFALLRFLAEQRGLSLDEATGQYILARCRRDAESMSGILGSLDEASLAAQRRLSVPFVKSVMGW